jgi:hypothetical protein
MEKDEGEDSVCGGQRAYSVFRLIKCCAMRERRGNVQCCGEESRSPAPAKSYLIENQFPPKKLYSNKSDNFKRVNWIILSVSKPCGK